MSEELVPVFIMGKRYDVPPSLTIMKAMEYAGYQLVRGVGCRGGFCGACATVYRLQDDDILYFGLACQTVVQPSMYLVQIPFFPATRADYLLYDLAPRPEALFSLYPELLRCLGCGTCTKACPQDLDVKAYMAAAMRGDIARVADLSFDCIMCGLCAARCPVGESQYNIAVLCRRLYGRNLSPHSDHLDERLEQIADGAFDKELSALKALSVSELEERYMARVIEPAD
jgi:ferredoxin